jgi:hypothetical protein
LRSQVKNPNTPWALTEVPPTPPTKFAVFHRRIVKIRLVELRPDLSDSQPWEQAARKTPASQRAKRSGRTPVHSFHSAKRPPLTRQNAPKNTKKSSQILADQPIDPKNRKNATVQLWSTKQITDMARETVQLRPTEAGCPRSLAFGHRGSQRARKARSADCRTAGAEQSSASTDQPTSRS